MKIVENKNVNYIEIDNYLTYNIVRIGDNMKKLKTIMVVFIALFGFISVVDAGNIPYGSSGMSVGECLAFADAFHTISKSEGQYYYRYCFQASCSSGKYVLANKVMVNGYRCANGNYDPYHKVTSDGCSRYNGSCNKNTNPYCTRVEFVDCNKKSDGSLFAQPTTQATTVKTTVKTTQATTAKQTVKTTVKQTKKKSDTGKITIPASTTTTTTTTTRRKSNNTNIKKVIMNGTEQAKYNNKKTSYNLPLPEEIDEITVECELEDPLATYVVEGNTGLQGEDKVIKIIVTAEDGTTKVVEFNVNHDTDSKSDCSLAQIYIEKYPIDFASNNYVYNLKLPKDVTSLDMEVIATDSIGAKYSIENNEKLKHKSVVNILVVAQDGTECNYEIHISKDNNFWKLLIVIVLIVAGLIVAAIFLFKYIKKSKGKYKYE